jgi:hypothetical protein
MFYQHTKGYLEDEVWFGWQRMILTYFQRPGFQVWWQQRRLIFNPKFVEFLESTEPDVAIIAYHTLAQQEAAQAS